MHVQVHATQCRRGPSLPPSPLQQNRVDISMMRHHADIQRFRQASSLRQEAAPKCCNPGHIRRDSIRQEPSACQTMPPVCCNDTHICMRQNRRSPPEMKNCLGRGVQGDFAAQLPGSCSMYKIDKAGTGQLARLLERAEHLVAREDRQMCSDNIRDRVHAQDTLHQSSCCQHQPGSAFVEDSDNLGGTFGNSDAKELVSKLEHQSDILDQEGGQSSSVNECSHTQLLKNIDGFIRSLQRPLQREPENPEGDQDAQETSEFVRESVDTDLVGQAAETEHLSRSDNQAPAGMLAAAGSSPYAVTVDGTMAGMSEGPRSMLKPRNTDEDTIIESAHSSSCGSAMPPERSSDMNHQTESHIAGRLSQRRAEQHEQGFKVEKEKNPLPSSAISSTSRDSHKEGVRGTAREAAVRRGLDGRHDHTDISIVDTLGGRKRGGRPYTKSGLAVHKLDELDNVYQASLDELEDLLREQQLKVILLAIVIKHLTLCRNLNPACISSPLLWPADI